MRQFEMLHIQVQSRYLLLQAFDVVFHLPVRILEVGSVLFSGVDHAVEFIEDLNDNLSDRLCFMTRNEMTFKFCGIGHLLGQLVA